MLTDNQLCFFLSYHTASPPELTAVNSAVLIAHCRNSHMNFPNEFFRATLID